MVNCSGPELKVKLLAIPWECRNIGGTKQEPIELFGSCKSGKLDKQQLGFSQDAG
jgi:hypothetical protein